MEACKNTEREAPELMRQILRYLDAHPDALDTADGIAKWWVYADGKAVEKAIERLMQKGILQRRKLGGLSYYGLHQDYRGIRSDDLLRKLKEDGTNA